MVNEVLDFLNDIKKNGGSFFIEAEAKPEKMKAFINEYNSMHTPSITLSSDGIITLQDDANKWSVELRLYVPVAPPAAISSFFGRNKVYRPEYAYRLNDNGIIRELFKKGCRIGMN